MMVLVPAPRKVMPLTWSVLVQMFRPAGIKTVSPGAALGDGGADIGKGAAGGVIRIGQRGGQTTEENQESEKVIEFHSN